jgi:dimeric dUTPase (all-alpha-NTP-PPase superfamily)
MVGSLAIMLNLQSTLTNYLFANSEAPVEFGSEEHIKETIACLAVEASEALAPFLTSTKPWKDRYPDMNHIDEEMIDVLHYLLTYWNLRGFTAGDIFDAYQAKNSKNFKRLEAKLESLK